MLAIYAIQYVANSQIWQYIISTERTIRFQYSIPVTEFIVGWLVVALSAFMSAYIPYKLYRKLCHPIFTGDYFNASDMSVICGDDTEN